MDEGRLRKACARLRAFAIQVSLARIASIAAKNDSDRQLLAIRIGALTKRFIPIYLCAFGTNPLGVSGAGNDPCFYYDSAMVEYATGLFDLAMVALPKDDAKRLFDSVTGSFVSPINIVEVLNALLAIARDAITYGRTIGALYRDSVELEVQVWINTPAIDDRPLPAESRSSTSLHCRPSTAQGNDDLQAWLAAIAALRAQGLDPLPQPKFFGELGGLMRYICDQITQDPGAADVCKYGLPKTLSRPISVLSRHAPSILVGDVPVRMGDGGRPPRVVVFNPPGPGPTTPGPGRSVSHPGPSVSHPGPSVSPNEFDTKALQDIDARIKKADDIVPVMVAQLANSSSQTFGAGTVRDAGTQMVNALRSINALVKQASDINRVQTLQQEYQTVREMIGDRITAIQGLVTAVTSPTADKVTATNAAKAIIDQIKGIQGLQGAEELVQRALVLNRRAAGVPSTGPPALQDIDASIMTADKSSPRHGAQLANSSSQTFGDGTVSDVGTQIVNALKSINAQVKQASEINRVQEQQYKAIQQRIVARISAIQKVVDAVMSPTADKTTAADAAKAIVDQIQGIQGLQGIEALVQQVLAMNRKAASGG